MGAFSQSLFNIWRNAGLAQIFCRARRFDAGILTDFKSKQRSPSGKRCSKMAFRQILNRLSGSGGADS